ncbi:MAG: thioredoxin [Chloroflexales bacterium]|nr:thioredoxin [Chloroflexales bacterium]
MNQSELSAIIDVNEADFETNVISQSHHTVVVVDFWAPWCGPCRVLGPILERMAHAAEGAWILAKVNVDNNQSLSQRYNVQGIPAVKAFKNGAVVEQFAGALPESQITTWLSRIVPSRKTQQLALLRETALHNPKAVRHELASMHSASPHDDSIKVTYGGVLARLNDPIAYDILRSVNTQSIQYAEAQAWLVLLSAIQSAVLVSTGVAEQYAQAIRNFSDGDVSASITQLLTLVTTNRNWQDDAARKTLLAIFNVIGDDHPLVPQARRELAIALF